MIKIPPISIPKIEFTSDKKLEITDDTNTEVKNFKNLRNKVRKDLKADIAKNLEKIEDKHYAKDFSEEHYDNKSNVPRRKYKSQYSLSPTLFGQQKSLYEEIENLHQEYIKWANESVLSKKAMEDLKEIKEYDEKSYNELLKQFEQIGPSPKMVEKIETTLKSLEKKPPLPPRNPSKTANSKPSRYVDIISKFIIREYPNLKRWNKNIVSIIASNENNLKAKYPNSMKFKGAKGISDLNNAHSEKEIEQIIKKIAD